MIKTRTVHYNGNVYVVVDYSPFQRKQVNIAQGTFCGFPLVIKWNA
jgi:hypothetical protein